MNNKLVYIVSIFMVTMVATPVLADQTGGNIYNANKNISLNVNNAI